MKIYYVNEEPRDITNNAALVFSHANIKYFPNDRVHLVVLYAACRSLLNAMASLRSDLPTDLILPSPPEPPTISQQSVGDIGGFLTGSAPTYDRKGISPDFADANHWLNNEEDSEMVSSRIEVIGAQLEHYAVEVQEELNKYNKETIAFQADVEKDLKNADLKDSKETRDIEKYTQEVQSYQVELSMAVQDYVKR